MSSRPGIRTAAAARAVLLVSGVAVLLALGLVAAFVRSAGASTGGTATRGGSATFTDPAGDAETAAPDITSITINSDPATGALAISITATGYQPATPDGLERDVFMWLDTDKNGSTGSSSGSEYVLVRWNDSSGAWWDIARWDGSKWQSIPPPASVGATRRGDQLNWTLNAADLGITTGFAFYLSSGAYDANDNTVGRDFAPDSGKWAFDLSGGSPATTPTTTTTTTTTTPAPSTKVKLLIDAPKTTPARAVAGRQLTVTFRVNFQKEEQGTAVDAATGQMKPITVISWSPVPGGKMVCDPSVAGKVIAHSESFKNGQARLSFVVPKTAKGKLLRVSVKITATEAKTGQTVTATRIAGIRVR